MKTEKEQLYAFSRRDEIQLGDTFVWRLSGNRYGEFYSITSGTLPPDYLATSKKEWFGEYGTAVLTVIKCHEGRNGYGDFVDYWLTKEPFDNSRISARDCIIINGVDAFRMERA